MATWIKPVFVAAAVYDGVLGLASAAMPGLVFDLFGVTPVNHPGYVQFPALLLLVFAAMFARIAASPAANRSLIPYGIGLKVAYVAVVFGHELAGGVPWMWVPFAWADLVFLALFALAYRRLG